MTPTLATCGSRATAFSGARVAVRCSPLSGKGASAAVMMKKGIHPEWHPEAPVICNGVQVMTVGGVKPSYNVDIYSGNHPFYQGKSSMLITDDGALSKFKNRFADLGALSEVGAVASLPGKAFDPDEQKRKDAKKAKAKGKK
ncbi:plastid/chloroplast ribosomal protein L31 [Haematococcus lacustris]|nr:hypothetical protein QJQ45_024764 [Haematococcus lacustris]